MRKNYPTSEEILEISGGDSAKASLMAIEYMKEILSGALKSEDNNIPEDFNDKLFEIEEALTNIRNHE